MENNKEFPQKTKTTIVVVVQSLSHVQLYHMTQKF